ncbi:GDSL-type esterase/lipase family protein [Sphaerisporangium dianthi]|uniref:GDSL-type esterase/lipase family protein n=1 Tax=Sphaerisporangium dianthi TaxID=1436120 RepID=A0ABV9CKX4_9ACTN
MIEIPVPRPPLKAGHDHAPSLSLPARAADNDNEGHPGWLIGDIDRITDNALATYQPNVVLLHIGTNDMNRNVDPAGAPARLGNLIDRIFRDSPNVTVTTGDLVDVLHPNDTGYRKMGLSSTTASVRSREPAGWNRPPATAVVSAPPTGSRRATSPAASAPSSTPLPSPAAGPLATRATSTSPTSTATAAKTTSTSTRERFGPGLDQHRGLLTEGRHSLMINARGLSHQIRIFRR